MRRVLCTATMLLTLTSTMLGRPLSCHRPRGAQALTPGTLDLDTANTFKEKQQQHEKKNRVIHGSGKNSGVGSDGIGPTESPDPTRPYSSVLGGFLTPGSTRGSGYDP